jgi:hypothetical protein
MQTFGRDQMSVQFFPLEAEFRFQVSDVCPASGHRDAMMELQHFI